MSIQDRIQAILARTNVLTVRLAKAAGKRPRVPGDGDGDGIANEGKKPKGGNMAAISEAARRAASATRGMAYNNAASRYAQAAVAAVGRKPQADKPASTPAKLPVGNDPGFPGERMSADAARRFGLLKSAGPKRPRVPGDGDGDGIPNEGKKPKGSSGEKMSMDAASRFFPKHADKLKSLKDGESVTILTNPAKAQFSRLTRSGSEFKVEENVRPRGVAQPKTRDQVQRETNAAVAALNAPKPKKEPSLIDVLNHPEGKQMVRGIEDTISSLRDKKGDKILGNVLRAQIKDLHDKHGFKYNADDVLRHN